MKPKRVQHRHPLHALVCLGALPCAIICLFLGGSVSAFSGAAGRPGLTSHDVSDIDERISHPRMDADRGRDSRDFPDLSPEVLLELEENGRWSADPDEELRGLEHDESQDVINYCYAGEVQFNVQLKPTGNGAYGSWFGPQYTSSSCLDINVRLSPSQPVDIWVWTRDCATDTVWAIIKINKKDDKPHVVQYGVPDNTCYEMGISAYSSRWVSGYLAD